MSYQSKAKDSFQTKIRLFVYYRVSRDIPEFELGDFVSFSISPDLVREYTTVYWQEHVDFKIRKKTIKEIEKQIDEIETDRKTLIKDCEEHYVKQRFPEIFPKSDFDTLMKAEACYYCGITLKEINQLAELQLLQKKNLRGWTLEIDRLDPNLEYTPDNCEMCCYWCNNAKTDEFTATEFKPIGEQIAIALRKRLRRLRFMDDGAGMTVIKK